MVKTKAASRRRPYEYDHHYGVSLKGTKAGEASPAAAKAGMSSPRGKAAGRKKTANKR